MILLILNIYNFMMITMPIVVCAYDDVCVNVKCSFFSLSSYAWAGAV